MPFAYENNSVVYKCVKTHNIVMWFAICIKSAFTFFILEYFWKDNWLVLDWVPDSKGINADRKIELM